MAPAKRPSPLDTHALSSAQNKRHGSHSPSSDPSSPSQPKGRKHRPQNHDQPRDLGHAGSFAVQSSSASRLVDPSLQPSAGIATSPVPSSEGTVRESASRRESTSSTMRTQPMAFEGTTTSTPTGRVSKAKKGKRVHACAFEGCGKVFTRAEHRRRHELNHNPDALFPCNRPGCRKAFHRLDLLQRHQERHDLEHQLDTQSSHGRQITQHSAPVDASMSMPPSSMASPQTTGARTSGGLSIGSLVNHPQGEYHPRYTMGTPSFTGFSRPVVQYVNGFPSSDDSIFYTPESSQSPVSEQYGRYPHRQSISSSSSVAGFEAQASPMINGAAQWIPSSAPPNVLPPNMFEEHSYMTTNADSSLPIPLTNLDGDEFDIIRRELSYAPGILSNPSGAPVPDAIRLDCLEHYWRNFHPYFPVVHRPTFLPTKPSPLLASAMVAIGSQFDQRSDAKQYSLTLLEVATRLLRRRDSITSRSRLADLQTVFLLEVLSKYFARRIEVDMSARFRALFASLDQAKRTLSTSPLAVFKTLRPNHTKEDLTKAHKFWIDHETRRRVLQAFAILDMQQILFFEQPATIVQHPRTRLSTETAKASMSLPCEQELWETSPIDEWKGFAADHKNLEASKVGQSPPQGGDPKLDYFQMQASLQADPYALHRFCFEDEDTSLASVVGGTPRTSMSFNHHAMALAKQTPIKSLLIVSAESWIFGKKLESEAEFEAARQRLRSWVNTGTDSVAALWHATALLRKQVIFTASETNPQEVVASFRTTRMLHESWCIYLATLVVWAHGLYPSLSHNTGGQRSRTASVTSAANSNRSHHSSTSSSSGHPSLMDSNDAAQEAQTYLQATDVATPVELTHVDPALLGRIHGLLEVVRMQKILPLMGGLMNEAERVLFRLVEGRSSLSHF